MLYLTHAMMGIVFFFGVYDKSGGGNVLIFFVLVVFFSLFPDIDEEHSFINRVSGPLGTIAAALFRHRGIFHSVFLYAALFLIARLWRLDYYAWAVLAGYGAHLLGDVLTPMGVRPLYPLSDFKIRGIVRSGGLVELCILLALTVIVVAMIMRL